MLFGLLAISTLTVTITFISSIGEDKPVMETNNGRDKNKSKLRTHAQSKTMSMEPIPMPVGPKKTQTNAVMVSLSGNKREKTKDNNFRRG